LAPRTRLFDDSIALLIFALAVACAVALIHIASVAPLKVVFDYNEGWNAYHAAAAMSGSDSLYPSANSLMPNNYPPLSFYIVGLLGRITGDYVIAGRIVCLLATISVAGAVTYIARQMGCAVTDACFAALIFLAMMLASTTYVGVDDPQLLAHAIGCAGFSCVLGMARRRTNIIVGAILLTSAGFLKHNLIVQPVALWTWLLVYDRRNAWLFFVSGLLSFALGLALCYKFFGIALFEQLLSMRAYELGRAASGLQNWLTIEFGAAVAGAILLFRRSDPHAVLCGLYLLLALTIGTAFAGGAGVAANAFFDASIASALVAGVTINRLRQTAKLAWATVAVVTFVLPLFFEVALNAQESWISPEFWTRPMATQVAKTDAAIKLLRSHNGPALCEMLALCYWAGKPPGVDSFGLAQGILTGRREDHDLIQRLDAHYYRVIVLDQPSRLSVFPTIAMALRRNYRVDHSDISGLFLLPLSPS
jgi:hypothetical protein